MPVINTVNVPEAGADSGGGVGNLASHRPLCQVPLVTLICLHHRKNVFMLKSRGTDGSRRLFTIGYHDDALHM